MSYALLAWSLGYGAILPELRDELNMSASVASMHGSMFGVCLILFAGFGRRPLASVSNRTVLALAIVGMAAGGLLFGLGHSTAFTLTGAGLGGAGAALLVIVVPAIVFVHQPQATTETMATLNAFPMVSATLLPLAVSAAVATDLSWRVSYLVPLLFIVFAIAVAVARAAVPQAVVADRVGLRTVFRIPRFGRRWFVLVCGVLVELGTGIWAASIMHDLGGASKGLAALLTIGFFIGMAVGRLAITALLERVDEKRVLVLSFAGTLVALAPFLLGPTLVVRVIGLTLFGLCLSPVYPVSISRMFELHHDTAALGRAAALASGFGVTFGPLLLGAIADLVGLRWATVVLPVFVIVALVTLRRPGAREAAVPSIG